MPTATLQYGGFINSGILTGGKASVPGTFSIPSTVPASVGSYSGKVLFTPTDSVHYLVTTVSITIKVTKAPTTITELPTAILQYGGSSKSAILSGGKGSVPGTFSITDTTIPPSAGPYTTTVLFTPTDSRNYSTATGNITITVNKISTTITELPTATLQYGGSANAATLTGGSGSVPGSFSIPDITVPPSAGSFTTTVLFTPTYRNNYFEANSNITITVTKAPTSITELPSAILQYGDSANLATLTGGSGSVSGFFSISDITVPPSVGSFTTTVLFTPRELNNYFETTSNITIAVTKAPTSITELPTAILQYGGSANLATLTGGSGSVDGYFSIPDTSIPSSLGPFTTTVLFTPRELNNYFEANSNITITVTKAPTTITELPTATLQYGDSANLASLSGGSGSVDGSFSIPDTTVPPSAGSFTTTVLFTPTYSNNYFEANSSITITVTKAPTTIIILPRASLHYGSPANLATLTGGSGSVDGDFSITNTEVPSSLGPYPATVLFRPKEQWNYDEAIANITIMVRGPYDGMFLLSDQTDLSVKGKFMTTDEFVPHTASNVFVNMEFIPNNRLDFLSVPLGNIRVTVIPSTEYTLPSLPLAGAIEYGQRLSSSSLHPLRETGELMMADGTIENIEGTFSFTDPSFIPSAVGNTRVSVTFTPDEPLKCAPTQYETDVTVHPAEVPINTATLTTVLITYGQPVSASNLTPSGDVELPFTMANSTIVLSQGTLAFQNPDAIYDAGRQSVGVVFTPSGSNFLTSTANVMVEIAQATPTITIDRTPVVISGSTLGMVPIPAHASTAGSFAWLDPNIAPGVSGGDYEIIFTPSSSNYITANTTTGVLVLQSEDLETPIIENGLFTSAPGNEWVFDNMSHSARSGSIVLTPQDGATQSTVSQTIQTIPGFMYRLFYTVSDTSDIRPVIGTTPATVIRRRSGVYETDFLATQGTAVIAFVIGTVSTLSNVKVQAVPFVTAPLLSPLDYGTPLSGSNITPVGSIVTGTYEFADPAYIPDPDATSTGVMFTPSNPYFASVLVESALTVKNTPVSLAGVTATSIQYGQTLGDSTFAGVPASLRISDLLGGNFGNLTGNASIYFENMGNTSTSITNLTFETTSLTVVLTDNFNNKIYSNIGVQVVEPRTVYNYNGCLTQYSTSSTITYDHTRMSWANRLVATAVNTAHKVAFGYHPTEPRIYVAELDANGISLSPTESNVIVSIWGMVHASNVVIRGENTVLTLVDRDVNTPLVFQLEGQTDKEYSIQDAPQ